jgi:hypothetical protein
MGIGIRQLRDTAGQLFKGYQTYRECRMVRNFSSTCYSTTWKESGWVAFNHSETGQPANSLLWLYQECCDAFKRTGIA